MTPSWQEMNGLIREALAGSDSVGDLERLFETTDDGYVALRLAEHLLRSRRPCEAIDWFARAHERLPLESYRDRAADGRAEALRACPEPPPPSSPLPGPPHDPALHVVCCTKRKIWHDDPDAPRYVPAGRAYNGRTFQQWGASQEAANGDPWVVLSAKHGFIAPDRPLEDYDVTFSNPGTHPIDDALLRAQAAAPWAEFGRPLTGFRRVVVHGSGTYAERVQAAFADTGVEISRWDPPPPGNPPPLEPPPETPPVVDLGAALAELPDAVVARAEELLPEWPVLESIAELPPPLDTLAALGVALNNYNLGRGGADEYWAEAQRFVGKAKIIDVATLRARLDALLSMPVAARDHTDRQRKRARVRRLFESPIPRLLTRRVRRVGAERLWREVAAAPGPSGDAKTVVYAMRTVALLHRRKTGKPLALPAGMPLPVDMRIAWITLSSGLIPASPAGAAADMEHEARRIASDRREEIANAWNAVAAAGGRSAMALDSLLWLAAKRVYDRRTDRVLAAGGVRDLLTDLGADSSAAAVVAAALTSALPERSDSPPSSTLPPFDLDAVHADVEAAFDGAVVGRWEEPARPATYDPAFGDEAGALEPAVRSALFDRVLTGGRLYTHQARAIEAALEGRDVAIETATASGKTLCYQVPILDALCRDPTATALYLAPINALVADQLAAVQRFADRVPPPRGCEEFVAGLKFGDRLVSVARYDGGVPAGAVRAAVRGTGPRLLITNPDMLSRGLIPHHALWRRFFSGLRYVVLDEMHTYRGLFGAHIANVLRRLWRMTTAFGASPRVIGCSASIGNPEELFQHLVGREPTTVIRADDSGAPSHRRRTMVVDTTSLQGAGDRMVPAASDLVAGRAARGDAPTIAFMRSIREVDGVHASALRNLARSHPQDAGSRWVRTYKREIPAEQKAEIIRQLRDGQARAVIATTALQMGIDIGSLSVAVIGGFPGRVAALRQSVGRAGRAGGGLAVLLLGNAGLDQHYALRPDELNGPPERVNVHPDNEEIVRRHVLAAADERPLRSGDGAAFGPTTSALVEALRGSGDLVSNDDGWLVPAGKHRGCGPRLDIRTTVGFDCPVRDSRGVEVARPDAARALRHYHPEARFLIDGRAYAVEDFTIDWDAGEGYGVARRLDRLDALTRPDVDLTCEEIDTLEAMGGGPSRAAVARGRIRTVVRVPAFHRMYADRMPERVELGARELPPHAVRTYGLWFDLPRSVLNTMPERDGVPALRSAGEALRLAGAVMCQTDTIDVGLHIQAESSPLRIYLSDIEEGGNGLTATMFGDVAGLLQGALQRLEDCPHCRADPDSRGCPKCVTADWGHAGSVYRAGGIRVLEQMRQDLALFVADP